MPACIQELRIVLQNWMAVTASSLWIFFSVSTYVGRRAGMGRKTVRKTKPSNWSLMVPVLIRSLWFLNYFFQPVPIPSIQSICNQLIRSPLESYKSIWHFWSLLKPQMEIWCLWRIKKIKRTSLLLLIFRILNRCKYF